MRDLPPPVARAVQAELANVEGQLRRLPTDEVLAEEDLEWSLMLDDGWHMFVTVVGDSRTVMQDELVLCIAVSVGRLRTLADRGHGQPRRLCVWRSWVGLLFGSTPRPVAGRSSSRDPSREPR